MIRINIFAIILKVAKQIKGIDMFFLIILLCLIVIVIGISIYENTHFNVKKYSIKHKCFNNKNIRALFISDLHNCSYGKENIRLLNAIKKSNPDFILIGGDVFNGISKMNNSNAKSFVKVISKNYKVIYALGNHEFRFYLYPDDFPGNKDEFEKLLNDCQVTLLDNEQTRINIKGIDIDIYGLTIERKYYKRFKSETMPYDYTKSMLPEKNDGVFSILLAHNPKYFIEYCDFGADLILSGHYHGGLVRFGKQGVASPTFDLFPKYSYGLIKNKKSKMIVSGGLGIHTIRFRLFNRPELVVIDFSN